MQTRDDKAVVRLMPDQVIVRRDRRRAVMDAASATAKATISASAACRQDFLYGDDGLPE